MSCDTYMTGVSQILHIEWCQYFLWFCSPQICSQFEKDKYHFVHKWFDTSSKDDVSLHRFFCILPFYGVSMFLNMKNVFTGQLLLCRSVASALLLQKKFSRKFIINIALMHFSISYPLLIKSLPPGYLIPCPIPAPSSALSSYETTPVAVSLYQHSPCHPF